VEKARNPGPCFFIKQGGNSNPGDRINNGTSYISIALHAIEQLNTEIDGGMCLQAPYTSVDIAVVRWFNFKHLVIQVHSKH
jgi:hypothetical protein